MFTPEHLHVALNHIALIGLPFAIIPLAVALIRKSPAALFSGLLIVLICGLTLPIVMETGDGASERLVTDEAGAQLDYAGSQFMDEHEERADLSAIFVYITAGLAAAGLLVMKIAPQHQYKLSVPILISCLVCTILLLWTAEAGGRIRHPEFRPTAADSTP